MVVIQAFNYEVALQSQFRARSSFGKSVINGDFQGDIYLGSLPIMEKRQWAGTLHRQCNFSAFLSVMEDANAFEITHFDLLLKLEKQK